jgi:hypothetical protein
MITLAERIKYGVTYGPEESREQLLHTMLELAFREHKKHGAFYGANFVECAHCKFHIHAFGPNAVIKHWGINDWETITDINDKRLREGHCGHFTI